MKFMKSKKLLISVIAVLVALVLAVSGCGANNSGDGEQGADIEGAINYLKGIYKDEGSTTAADFKRFSTVRIAGAPYEVVWTANVAENLVKIVDNGDGTCTVELNKECFEATPYQLTATVSADGKSASHTWNYVLKCESGADIVDLAYGLGAGQSLEKDYTLVGTITAINTPYDETYKNVTVTIQVAGREDKPIVCFRLKGDGADALTVGNVISVSGKLMNYNGTIEFDAGCVLNSVSADGTTDSTTSGVEGDTTTIEGDSTGIEGDSTGIEGDSTTNVSDSTDTPVDSTTGIPVDGTTSNHPTVGSTTNQPTVGSTTNQPTAGSTTKPTAGSTTKPTAGNTTQSTTAKPTTTKPVTPGKDPEANSTLSIQDAIALGLSKEHNIYTSGKYYVVGKITEIYNTTYGNMKLIAENGKGDVLTIYGTYDANGKYRFDDMKTQPKVGDVVKIYGIIGQFNGTAQIKNGWIVEINGKKLESSQPTSGGKPVTDTKKILADIATLKANEAEDGTLGYTATLTGKVLNVNTAYDPQFGNVTITIAVDGTNIKCYRLSGTGADAVAMGDTVTVTGEIIKYKGSIQFTQGCTLDKRVAAKVENDPKKIVEAAFKLKDGEVMDSVATLTGKIISVDTPYDASFQNITVTFTVEGKNLKCYRLKGDGVDKIKEGDTITVTGMIKNYMGTIEFDNGCTLDKYVAGTSTKKEYKVVDSPKTGVAYKFGMPQGNLNQTYYLAGGMQDYYMATVSNGAGGIDVYLEETEGGYYLYTKDNGKKLYINMVVSGTHVNGAYESKASTVYTFDKEHKTLIGMAKTTDAEEAREYWFGTRNDKQYTTVGPCAVEYEGFYCMFYEEK